MTTTIDRLLRAFMAARLLHEALFLGTFWAVGGWVIAMERGRTWLAAWAAVAAVQLFFRLLPP